MELTIFHWCFLNGLGGRIRTMLSVIEVRERALTSCGHQSTKGKSFKMHSEKRLFHNEIAVILLSCKSVSVTPQKAKMFPLNMPVIVFQVSAWPYL